MVGFGPAIFMSNFGAHFKPLLAAPLSRKLL
jgi:hypothetical protein